MRSRSSQAPPPSRTRAASAASIWARSGPGGLGGNAKFGIWLGWVTRLGHGAALCRRTMSAMAVAPDASPAPNTGTSSAASSTTMATWRVCWRLCGDLAARGVHVRLWVDDASALAWMAPEGHAGVELRAWPAAAGLQGVTPGEVVVEAFGCELPTGRCPHGAIGVVASLDQPCCAYLSAEDYVERSHGLPSPQFSGPGRGLIKHFFYPASPPVLATCCGRWTCQARRRLQCRGWLAGQGLAPPGRAPRQPVLLPGRAGRKTRLLADQPTRLLACPSARAKLVPWPNLRIHAPPYLTRRLRPPALGLRPGTSVRGEDSFVRAQWAQTHGLAHLPAVTTAHMPPSWKPFMAQKPPARASTAGAVAPGTASHNAAARQTLLQYNGDHATGWRAALLAQATSSLNWPAFLAALGKIKALPRRPISFGLLVPCQARRKPGPDLNLTANP